MNSLPSCAAPGVAAPSKAPPASILMSERRFNVDLCSPVDALLLYHGRARHGTRVVNDCHRQVPKPRRGRWSFPGPFPRSAERTKPRGLLGIGGLPLLL